MVPDFVAIALRSPCGAGAVIGLESVLAVAKVVAAELAPPPAPTICKEGAAAALLSLMRPEPVLAIVGCSSTVLATGS